MQTTDKNNSRFLPWFVWGFAALFYAYEFFLQVSPSVMVPDLMDTFNVTAGGLGSLAALYFYSYAIMQIPAGIFLDALGPRRLLTISSATCVLGAFIFGIAHQLWQAEIGRLLIGFGSAFAVIGTFKLASIWFKPSKFAFMVGLTVMIGMFGAVIGGSPLALLVSHFGWRQSMMLLAGIGLVLCFLIWLVVRDKPKHLLNKTTPDNYSQQNTGICKSLIYIFKQKQSWLIGIYGGLMFAPTSAFAALWGVPFFMTKYSMTRPDAALTIAMIFIGWAVGSPLWGWYSDKIKRRKPSMYIGAFLTFIAMVLIIYVNLPLDILYVTLFCFGFFSAGFLPSFSMIREISPPNINATAVGFMNMMNMIGGAVLQPLIGWILDRYWQGHFLDGARVFSLHAFHISLLTLPCILLLALLLVPFIQETYCEAVNLESEIL